MKKKIFYSLSVFVSCLLFVVISLGINYLNYGVVTDKKEFRTIQDASKKIAVEIVTQLQNKVPAGVLADFDEQRYFKTDEDFTALLKNAETDLLAAVLAQATAQKYSIRLNLDDAQKKLMIEDLNKKAELYSSKVFDALEHIQNTMPPYSFSGGIDWASNEKGKKVNITLYLDKKDTLSHIAAATDYYHTPAYVGLYKAVNFLMLLAVALGLLALGYLLYHLITLQLKKKNLSSNHDAFIEEAMLLITNKSFVAASNMLNEYHELVPDNAQVTALKTRLDIVIKDYDAEGDPKKAEAAIIKIENLQKKINKGNILELNEKKILSNLPAHEAVLLLEQSEQLESTGNIRKETQRICTLCDSLVETGDIRKAKAEAEKQIRKISDVASRDKIRSLLDEIENKMKENENKFKEAQAFITKESFDKAKVLLWEIKVSDHEYPEAMDLLKNIEISEKTLIYNLKPEKTGKDLTLYKKEVIMFARPDKIEPDVALENAAISRDKHFKLIVVGTKVIGENYGTNGTWIRGEQIEKAEIESGDVINIAKAYQMTVYIAKGDAAYGADMSKVTAKSTILAGEVEDLLSKSSKKKTSKGSKEVAGVFITATDSDYIMLIKRVPTAFTTAGIIFNETSPLAFGVENGVAFLATPEGIQILGPGMSVGYKGIKYKVYTN